MSKDMSRDWFQDNLAPLCGHCGLPITRTEIEYEVDGSNEVRSATFICEAGHPTPIEAADKIDDSASSGELPDH